MWRPEWGSWGQIKANMVQCGRDHAAWTSAKDVCYCNGGVSTKIVRIRDSGYRPPSALSAASPSLRTSSTSSGDSFSESAPRFSLIFYSARSA